MNTVTSQDTIVFIKIQKLMSYNHKWAELLGKPPSPHRGGGEYYKIHLANELAFRRY